MNEVIVILEHFPCFDDREDLLVLISQSQYTPSVLFRFEKVLKLHQHSKLRVSRNLLGSGSVFIIEINIFLGGSCSSLYYLNHWLLMQNLLLNWLCFSLNLRMLLLNAALSVFHLEVLRYLSVRLSISIFLSIIIVSVSILQVNLG